MKRFVFMDGPLHLIRPFLSPSKAEQIMVHGVAFFLRSRSSLALFWLADCYVRCTERFVTSNLELSRFWRSLKEPVNESQDEKFNFEYLKELIVRHSALILQCPEYFLVKYFCFVFHFDEMNECVYQ